MDGGIAWQSPSILAFRFWCCIQAMCAAAQKMCGTTAPETLIAFECSPQPKYRLLGLAVEWGYLTSIVLSSVVLQT
jgi:hypothetical protein